MSDVEPAAGTAALSAPLPPGARHHVVAIGSAIVDVIAHADDAFVAEHGLEKGTMSLVFAEDDAAKLYDAMAPGIESSGGSAANTAVGVASFGGRAGFIGRVRDDQLGEVFAHDIRAAGVDFVTPPASDGPSTARCLVLVSPDAQRTMQTYLGAASLLDTALIDDALVAGAAVLYCEGYLWDLDDAKAALVHAMEVAHANGRKVAFTLSDPFCVDRHRAEFVELAERHVDILFANESEICSLYETDDFDAALARVREHCEVACLTRSEKGSVIVVDGVTHEVAAAPADVLDTTGAGDLYAAGVLFGYTTGLGWDEAGRLGSAAAGEVISHLGARPDRPLTTLTV
jgi:sugar/nucleoside kinase (ribokinase family)